MEVLKIQIIYCSEIEKVHGNRQSMVWATSWPAFTFLLCAYPGLQQVNAIGSFCNAQLVRDLGILCSDGKTQPDANGCCFEGAQPTCPANCAGGSFSGGPDNWVCNCRSCASTTSFNLDMTTQERWLSAHNYFRCRHGVSLLETKERAVATASTYSQKCVFQHSSNSERDSAGENLAMGYRSPEAATEAWDNEISEPGDKTKTFNLR